MGGQSDGGIAVDSAVVAKELFGYKLKLVPGYPNSAAVKLAMERGEVDGVFANGWGDLKLQKREWISDRKVKIFVQHGFQKLAELPDVPLFIDLAKTELDRQALQVLLGRQEFSRPYFAPPGTPEDRVEILRTAFEATIKDPKFIAEVRNKGQIEINGAMNGKELTALVAKVSSSSPEAVKHLEKIFSGFRTGR